MVNTVHYQHPKLEDKNTDYHYIVSIRDKLLEELSRNEINVNIHLGAEFFLILIF